jgi:hypothetical protein
MENIENIENELVTEEVVETPEVAENVETTTEETPKMYTEAEFNAKLDEVMGKKIARTRAKIEREYKKKYGDLEDVLRAGMGKDNVEEMTADLREFYGKKGVKFTEKPNYSDRDIEVLARAEAEDIIRYGFDEVVEEVERLAQIGVSNMTARDKAIFRTLAEYRQSAERGMELSKMGVKEDVYTSKEFNDFASMFNSDTPITKIYELFNRETKPKKEIRTMGSMKQSQTDGVKDYYSPSDIEKMDVDELIKDHKKWEAVRRSMTGR